MTAETWEEATQDVAVQMPSWSEGEGLSLDEVLVDIEETLDDLRGGDHEKNEYATFRYLAWLGAVGYVHEKWGDARTFDFVGACDDVVRSVLVLLPKKQHDYGPDNILWGGVQGVVIRAHDKLARIKNLRKRANEAMTRGATPSMEPLSDSYFDLIGYGIVGAMLVKGTFQLPLEADVEAMRAEHQHALSAVKKGEIDTDEIADGDSVLVAIVRAVVRDEIAKREKAKSHG